MYEKVREMVHNRIVEVDLLGMEYERLLCMNCDIRSSKVMRIPLLHPNGDIVMRIMCPDCLLELFDRWEEVWDLEPPGLAR